MPQKTVTIAIVGDQQLIEGALDAFARQHGWQATMAEAEPPVTREEFARSVILKFITDSVTIYQADQAAQAARQQAAAATEQALMTGAVLTLEIS
jgi:hypothetical protein